MLSFPNCKINLGLQVLQKREDGYHDLETVFYPVALKDALEIIEANELRCEVTGLPVNDTTDNNLCVKAWHLLKNDFPDLPAVAIHLHKVIPMGAGLGGGSADAAFMLQMLNRKFQLQLSQEKLLSSALQLGSDCPFFIKNIPCFATGRGENLTPVNLDLSVYTIVLVNPGIHVSTKDAFSKLAFTTPDKSVKEIIRQPIESWKDDLKNDFETTVFSIHPEIEKIKEQLYVDGAIYASMSGSGSTVYAIFNSSTKADFSFPDNYKCVVIPGI